MFVADLQRAGWTLRATHTGLSWVVTFPFAPLVFCVECFPCFLMDSLLFIILHFRGPTFGDPFANRFNETHERVSAVLTVPGRRTSSSGTRTHRRAVWWDGAAECSLYPLLVPRCGGLLGWGCPRIWRPTADLSPSLGTGTRFRICLCKE